MSDIDVRVAAARTRIKAAQQGQAQAQHGYEVATGEAQRAAAALQEEFGVNSPQEAQALLAELEAAAEARTAEVESLLSGMGGS